MQADQHGAAFVAQCACEAQHVEAMAHIKVRGGFIPKLNAGIRGKGPRQEHPAPLAPGKARHGPFREMRDVEGRHRRLDKRVVIPERMAPLGHHLPHGKRKVRMEILPHPGQAPPPFGKGEAVQIIAHPRDAPARFQQAREDAQKGGFTRAVGTHHRGEAPLGQMQ